MNSEFIFKVISYYNIHHSWNTNCSTTLNTIFILSSFHISSLILDFRASEIFYLYFQLLLNNIGKLVIHFRNNLLRWCILRVIQQCDRHLDKVLNVDEFVRRLYTVIHSNDSVARALTIRFVLNYRCAIFVDCQFIWLKFDSVYLHSSLASKFANWWMKISGLVLKLLLQSATFTW